MITLQNGKLTVVIDTLGAQLQSVDYNGTEYLWQGDPKFWADRSPLLFPICSSLKEGKYTYRNREYAMSAHGFAKDREFSVEQQSASAAVFFLCSDEETRVVYPFDFELYVTYSLSEDAVKVDYAVKNLSPTELYFSIGAHEGFFCPHRGENCEIVFSDGETPPTVLIKGGLLTLEKAPLPYVSGALPLRDELCSFETLVFENLSSGSVLLRDRVTGKAVSCDISDFPYFLVWMEPGADFVCLEPWHGTPDRVGSSFDITEKADMIRVSSGDSIKKTHSFKILAEPQHFIQRG